MGMRFTKLNFKSFFSLINAISLLGFFGGENLEAMGKISKILIKIIIYGTYNGWMIILSGTEVVFGYLPAILISFNPTVTLTLSTGL